MRRWAKRRIPDLAWFFASLCAIFAVGGQLIMESYGEVGERETIFNARHIVLLVAGLAAAFAAFRTLRALRANARGRRDLHRLLKEKLRELPCDGSGCGFVLTTVVTTFAIGFLAHVGERDASIAHDASGWLAIALLVGIIAAIVARFVLRTLPEVVAILFTRYVAIEGKPYRSRFENDAIPYAARRVYSSPWRFGRPPPLHS